MKKITLIGASGFIGSAILQESLDRGHLVTAIVRHPEKIKINHPNLKIVSGDILISDSINEIIAGSDVVISSYNPGWNNPSIASETTAAYKNIINSVIKAKIPRILIVGGAGSLFVSPGKRLMDTDVFPKSFIPAVTALANVYYELLKSNTTFEWAFFSPAGNIIHGERTGNFQIGKDNLITNNKGESKISVEDYALAMIDEVENPQNHNSRFTIGYK